MRRYYYKEAMQLGQLRVTEYFWLWRICCNQRQLPSSILRAAVLLNYQSL